MRPRLTDSLSIAEIHEMRNRMSVQDMAKQLEVSVNTLYKYLNGYKAQKPKDADGGARVQITPPAQEVRKAVRDAEQDMVKKVMGEPDIVKSVRERFMERMAPKTELRISTVTLYGGRHTFQVSKDEIQIMNNGREACTVTKDGIDGLIAELSALKTAIADMKID